jgi:hypothetical protein
MAKRSKEMLVTFPTSSFKENRRKVLETLTLIDRAGGDLLGVRVMYQNQPKAKSKPKLKKVAVNSEAQTA